jgi:hypothetical protein
MRNRKQHTISPKRVAYRFPRTDASGLNDVLKVVNGTVYQSNRYEPERSEIRAIFDSIIGYCEKVEDAFGGIDYFTDSTRRKYKVELTKRSDRISRAQEIAYSGLLKCVTPRKDRTFAVLVLPRRLDGADPRENWKKDVVPSAEELFRLSHLFIWPTGDIREQLYWQFYQGIIQLDDLRRIHKCSGYLHGEPFYFIGKKVQRRDNYFCSDECRSDYNYKKNVEAEKEG